jgi:hypothetical protein
MPKFTKLDELVASLQDVRDSHFNIHVQRRRQGDGVIEEVAFQYGVGLDVIRKIGDFCFNQAGGGNYLVHVYGQTDPNREVATFEVNVPGEEQIPLKFRATGAFPFQDPTWGAQSQPPSQPQPSQGALPTYMPPWMMPPYPLMPPPSGGGDQRRMSFEDILGLVALRTAGMEPQQGNDRGISVLQQELRALRESQEKRALDDLRRLIEAKTSEPKDSETRGLLTELQRQQKELADRMQDQQEKLIQHFGNMLREQREAFEKEREQEREQFREMQRQAELEKRETKIRSEVAEAVQGLKDLLQQSQKSENSDGSTAAMWSAVAAIVPKVLEAGRVDLAPMAGLLTEAVKTSATASKEAQAQQTQILEAMMRTIGDVKKPNDLPEWVINRLTQSDDQSKQLARMADASGKIMATSIDMASNVMANAMRMLMPQEPAWVQFANRAVDNLGKIGEAMLTGGSEEEEEVRALPAQTPPPPPPQQQQQQAPSAAVLPAPAPEKIEPPTKYFTARLRRAIRSGMPPDALGEAVNQAYTVLLNWGGLRHKEYGAIWQKFPEDPAAVITWLAEPTGRTQADDWEEYLETAVASAKHWYSLSAGELEEEREGGEETEAVGEDGEAAEGEPPEKPKSGSESEPRSESGVVLKVVDGDDSPSAPEAVTPETAEDDSAAPPSEKPN